MSTAAATINRVPPLARLTRIELRKAVDTLSGLWLLVALTALTIVVIVVSCVSGPDDARTFRHVLANASEPMSILLPVAAILLVTAEWSQRTALTTFALVPRRGRVLSAKVGAVTVIALAGVLVSLPFTAAAFALLATHAPGTDGPGTWTLPSWQLGQTTLYILSSALSGVAYGIVLRRPAPAIVSSFALPIGFNALGHLSFLKGVRHWTDPVSATGELSRHAFTATEWAHAASVTVLWIALPIALGAVLLRRAEIR